MSKGQIENCRFIKCNGEGLRSRTGLFLFKKVDIINTVFENCSVKTNNNSRIDSYINLVLMTKCQMYNCKFLSCNIKSESSYSNDKHFAYIITAINSSIKNNEFNKCSCYGYADEIKVLYAINLYNSEETNSNFINFKANGSESSNYIYDNFNQDYMGKSNQVIDWKF